MLDLASGTQHETPFLDIAVSSGGTRGLRNLCFDPDYATAEKLAATCEPLLRGTLYANEAAAAGEGRDA